MNELDALMNDLRAAGLDRPEALKALDGDDPEASDETAPGDDPEASDETAPGEELKAVDADEFLGELRNMVRSELATLVAPISEAVKSLTNAATMQLNIQASAAETLKALNHTVEVMKATPVAMPTRPGRAVSSSFPPPRPLPTGAHITAAEVTKALDRGRISVSLHDALQSALTRGAAISDDNIAAVKAANS